MYRLKPVSVKGAERRIVVWRMLDWAGVVAGGGG